MLFHYNIQGKQYATLWINIIDIWSEKLLFKAFWIYSVIKLYTHANMARTFYKNGNTNVEFIQCTTYLLYRITTITMWCKIYSKSILLYEWRIYIFNVWIRWHFTFWVPCGILTVRDGKFELWYLMWYQ